MKSIRNFAVSLLPFCVLTVIVLTFSTAGRAQGFGSIQGTVTDGSGAVVGTAIITATQVQTGSSSSVNANNSGSFTFPSLAPAEYTISVAAAGFQKSVQSHVKLNADQALTLNFALQVGEVTQTVTVAANATQVDTTTGTVSAVIDQQRVNDLPLNGRNAAQLTELVAGVNVAPNNAADQGNTKTFPTAVTITANGSRADQTNYMLNGGNNVDEYTNVNGPFPFPDALQEFSVQTSNYNAEYGQNAGAVVNIITKSGGQQYHGDLFEYVRNRAFNARNYFATTVDPLKRNQFGGTIGGPVKIPHLMNGSRTQFFFGYQKTIIRSQQGGQSAFIPTQAEVNGDFSAVTTQIYDPVTKAPIVGNQILPSRLSHAAQSFMAHLPQVGGTGQVFYQKPISQGFNEYIARIDTDLTASDHLFGHYYSNGFNNAGILNNANLLTYADGSNISYQSALLSESHVFSSSLLNNVIFNYLREVSVRGPAAGAPSATDFGVQIPSLTNGIQQIGVPGFFNVGDNAQARFYRASYTLADDIHWVKGRHNMAFGFHGELSNVGINSGFNEPGYFTFNGNIAGSNLTNNALANFMMGYLYTFGQGSGQYLDEKNKFIGMYAQDSWKVNDRLTLNYGLRYEPFFPWQEKLHRIEQFNPDAFAAGRRSTIYPNAPAGLLFPGDSGVPEQGIRKVYTNIMPRVGFAWNVFGDGKTSIRGGGGMFFDTRQPGIFIGTMSVATPFSVNVAYTNPTGSFDNPYLGQTVPLPVPTPVPSNINFPLPVRAYTYDPSGNFNVPLSYNWNLALEQQLGGDMIMRLAYVGSHSSHLKTDLELNPATYIPGSTLGTDQRRRYQNFGNIIEGGMGADATYHSLQVTLERHFARGFSVLANYTWAKSLDNIPYGTSVTNLNPGQSYVYPVYSPNYKSLDRGPSDFDTRHVFSASYVIGPSNFHVGNRLTRFVLNGWQHTGIVRILSGLPVTIIAGTDRSGTGLSQDRAVYSGTGVYGSGACATSTAKCVDYLKISAFSLPAAGTFGNVVKGSVRAPNYANWDASVARSFSVHGSMLFQVRADYFNVLNHSNFLSPVNSLSAGGFGSLNAANDPRIAQMSGKFIF